MAVQLCAATRDFPVHDHLHASQTSKGCSFTGATAAAAAATRGCGSHVSDGRWVAVGDSDDATTTSGRRGDYTMAAREGCGAHCGCSKTNIRLGQAESFPGWKLAWKSPRAARTRKARVIVGVSADRYRSTGCLVNFRRMRAVVTASSSRRRSCTIEGYMGWRKDPRILVSCSFSAPDEEFIIDDELAMP